MERIQTDTFLKFQFVHQPMFSPDGEKILFGVSRGSLEENGYQRDLYDYRLADGQITKLTSGGDAGLFLWKDERTVLFSSGKRRKETGKEDTCFYEISLEGGEAREAFVLPVKASFVEKMEEGRYLIRAQVRAGGEEPDEVCEILEELPFWSNGGGFVSGLRTALYLYDEKTGALDKISGQWEDCGGHSVLGTCVLYKSCVWRDRKPSRGQIVWYDCRTKEKRILLEQGKMALGPVGFWKESEALVAASDGSRYGDAQYPDFYRMNLKDGSVRMLAEYGYSVGSGSVGSDARLGGGITEKAAGGKFYFITTVGESSCLCSLDADGKLEKICCEDGACDSFDVWGEHTVVCGLFGNRLAELYLDGKQITFFNRTEEYRLSDREPVECESRAGGKVRGYVMRPVDYDPDRCYPGILHVHGGPRTVLGSVFHHEMQLWANAGYFVFFCNPHGSDGRGDEFGDIRGKYGTIDYDDVMDFTDAVLEKYPQMDGGRLAVVGGSYGGFMTNWVIGHTGRFAAAVSQRCVSNWISMEHMSDIGPLFVRLNMDTDTEENAEKMWEHSPLKYASACRTPTLFIHSDEDYRCPMAEGIQMFSALKKAGCEARLCLIHGENHDLSRTGRPRSRIRRMKEILNWLDGHLK